MSKANPCRSVEGRLLHGANRFKPTTLVVFDPRVDDYGSLISGVPADADILVLRLDQDGVQQIQQALQALPSVEQIHIISHGGPGYVELGDRPLSLTTLNDSLWELQHWFAGRPVTSHCAIVLYGCQVAAGDGGAEFLQALHQLTGASVTASTTLTGQATLGGNWDLDVTVGTLTPKLAIAPDALATYGGTLISLEFRESELISGEENEVGAVYRFTDVTPGGTTEVDALITIDAINGEATLLTIDRPGADQGGFGEDEAFQPFIQGAVDADASVDFSIQFVAAGTESPVILSDFLVTVLDLDGNAPDDAVNRGVEFAALTNAVAFTLLGGENSELEERNDLAAGFADLAFLGTTNQGDDFSFEASVTFAYLNSSGFRLRAGVTGYEAGGGRQISLDFNENILDNLTPPIPPPVILNTPPVAVDDTATTAPGTPVSISILNNDVDAEDGIPAGGITKIDGSTTFGVTSFTLPSGATVTVNADDTVTYTPAAGFTGVDTFTYTVADSDGTNVTATVSVTVADDSPPNTPPTANPDTAVYLPNTPLTLDLVGNDTDPEDPNGIPAGGITAINGTPIAVGQPVTLPSGSTIALSPDGTVTYTPAPGLTTVEEFSYTVTDGSGATDEAIATLIPEGAPVANNDTAATALDTPITLDPLVNDTDPEEGIPGGGITQINGVDIVPETPVTLPSGGVVLLNEDGTITYTPPAGFLGVETFSYTVADRDGLTSTADVSITVSALDTDNDGVPDIIDIDDDNDGIPDAVEELGDPDRDTDGDGVLDRLDLDSDNDGILDVEEAGHNVGDPDGDGRLDGPYGPDGLADIVETAPESMLLDYTVVDTDGDGVRDFQDLDSDNDGITDAVEGGGPGQNPDPDGDGIIGTGTPVDTDGDGIADVADPDNGGTPSAVPDFDGDGRKDYRDLDTDNDGILDVVEQGAGYPDTNGDGVVDGLDGDGDGILDPVDAAADSFGSTPFSIAFPQDADDSNTPDWRELPITASETPGPGVVVGSARDDILNGFSDSDTLIGLGGNDRISGGSDPDVLRGGSGNDSMNGGSGRDDMNGGSGDDLMNGGSGNDRLLGGKGNDLMNGGRGRDLMRAGAGRDLISGDAGGDEIYGDRGRDAIDGGRGNDTLVGGFGADHLIGGQGRDRFVFQEVKDFGDTIKDFEILKDKLVFDDINGIDALSDLELRQRGANTLVSVRIDGSREQVATLLDVEAATLDARHFSF